MKSLTKFLATFMFSAITTACGGGGGGDGGGDDGESEGDLIAQNFNFANEDTATVLLGDTYTNLAFGQGSGDITYSSGDTAIAEVSDTGVVTTISLGTTLIRADIAKDSVYAAANTSYQLVVEDPLALDTDGDGLSDVDELDTYFTSPNLADTDGDGYSDYEEVVVQSFNADLNNYRFNPLIADIPRLLFEIVTVPNVDLNTEDTQGESSSTSNASGRSATDSSSTTYSAGGAISFEASTMVGGELGTGGASASSEVTLTAGIEANFQWTDTHTKELTEQWETAETAERSESQTITGGSVAIGIDIENTGDIGYIVDDLLLFLYSAEASGAAKPIGRLRLDEQQGGSFPNTTLLAGQSATGLIFSNTSLGRSDAEDFMAFPTSLIFRLSHAELLAEDSTPIAFNYELTAARAAKISIDYGSNRSPENYHIATSQDINNPGATLAELLEIAAIDFTEDQSQWTNPSGDSFSGLTGVRNVSDSGTSRWVVHHSVDDGLVVETTRYDTQNSDYSLSSIFVNASDAVDITYISDADLDGIGEREEFSLGTDPDKPDTDDDGIGDATEAKGESCWLVNFNGGYEVCSDARRADADGDGLNDLGERDNGTDPYIADSDEDGTNDNDDTEITASGPVTSFFNSTLKIVPSANSIQIKGFINTTRVPSSLTSVSAEWGDGETWQTSLDAGDSSYIFPTVSPVSHVYNTADTFTVTIRAEDDQANTFEETYSIENAGVIRYSDIFLASQGYRSDQHPRFVADVTGDGLDDLIGIANTAVVVVPSTGSGFGSSQTWWNDSGATNKIGFASLYGGQYDGINPELESRTMADVNNDGMSDIVLFGDDGVYVGLSTGSRFNLNKWSNDVADIHNTSSHLTDINGDGDLDLISFDDNIQCSINSGADFGTSSILSVDLDGSPSPIFTSAGAWHKNAYPIEMRDVDDDEYADIVGFAEDGVYVALGRGDCSFKSASRVLKGHFSGSSGWDDSYNFPRVLAEVSGDEKPDIVGFGDTVGISINRSTTGEVKFSQPTGVFNAAYFGANGKWRSYYNYASFIYSQFNIHPRILADIDGDSDLDIVGFTGSAWAGINDGDGDFEIQQWDTLGAIGLSDSGNWGPSSLSGSCSLISFVDTLFNSFARLNFNPTGNCNFYTYPIRTTGDINGDGAADLVGFGLNEVVVLPSIVVSKNL